MIVNVQNCIHKINFRGKIKIYMYIDFDKFRCSNSVTFAVCTTPKPSSFACAVILLANASGYCSES